MPQAGECDYSDLVEIDLDAVAPAVAGPKRPQDRLSLSALPSRFAQLLTSRDGAGYGRDPASVDQRVRTRIRELGPGQVISGGGEQGAELAAQACNTNPLTEAEMVNNRPTPNAVKNGQAPVHGYEVELGHGDVVIAAITSCTNTSNPTVMLAAGLLARKAAARGLRVSPTVKTSLAPGSRVVTDYLERTGLRASLEELGFYLVGYGCTTCIGNSGPLDPGLERAIGEHDLVAAAVLSGNRNFEARVHQSVRANFLMSPPLVVAFAIAGTIRRDLEREPLGVGADGRPVHLRDVWPTADELAQVLAEAGEPGAYRRLYDELTSGGGAWAEIEAPGGELYPWDPASTYIREPPWLEGAAATAGVAAADVHGARALALLGDSVTTDHISPAGAIKAGSPAARYLEAHGVAPADFNSYGARRGNHEVMVRGTFANVRIKNLMVPGTEGGVTVHHPDGERMSIFEAAERYRGEGVPLVVVAGQEYGTGSSRDWAAKGTRLLGVRAVLAQSFERIHRANLVMMGVLPCELPAGSSVATLGLDGSETFDLVGLGQPAGPRAALQLIIRRDGQPVRQVALVSRIDTPIEAAYYQHGGILPHMLRGLLD
jgi:aconitate hydratase